jgi:hypothetical protein
MIIPEPIRCRDGSQGRREQCDDVMGEWRQHRGQPIGASTALRPVAAFAVHQLSGGMNTSMSMRPATSPDRRNHGGLGPM